VLRAGGSGIEIIGAPFVPGAVIDGITSQLLCYK